MSAQEESKIDIILREVSDIRRGLYGDSVNKVPGLMQEHYDLKVEVEKLKDHRKKAIYWGAGFFVGAQISVIAIKKLLGL